jgi:hypothetical protein
MAQHDYVIDNASGATVRADINSALSAIQSLNSGTSAPSSTAAGMLWLDTTGGAPYVLKVRDAGNNHWLTLGNVTDPGADGNLELLPGKINLPSSGGIYESDGSTEILTESSGAVTLKNTSMSSTVSLANATFPSGHLVKTTFVLRTGGTLELSNNTITTACSTQYTCDSSSNKLILMGLGVIKRGSQNGSGAQYYYRDADALNENQNRDYFQDNDEMPIFSHTLDGYSGQKEILLKIQSLSNNSKVFIQDGNGFVILEIQQ